MQHRFRITDSSVDKFHAIAHAVGQWHDMDVKAVPTAWLAKFMGVTKPTALKHLETMRVLGFLERVETDWRPNAKQYSWKQTSETRKKYHQGYFTNYFNHVKALMLQTAKLKGNGRLTI